MLLCRRCMDADERFETVLDSCVELTPYGVQVRYPSMLDLEESDMLCALKESRALIEFVERAVDSYKESHEQA